MKSEETVYLSRLPSKSKAKDILGALGQSGYNVRNRLRVVDGLCEVVLLAKDARRLKGSGLSLFGNAVRISDEPPRGLDPAAASPLPTAMSAKHRGPGEVTIMLRNLPKSRPAAETLAAFQKVRNRYNGRDGSTFGQIVFPQGTSVTSFQRELRTIFPGVVVERISQDFASPSKSKQMREQGVTPEQEARTVRLHNIPPDWQLKTLLGAIKTALGKFECKNYIQRKKNGTAFMILGNKVQYRKLLGLKSFRYYQHGDPGQKGLEFRLYVTKLFDPTPPELIALAKKAGGNLSQGHVAVPTPGAAKRTPQRPRHSPIKTWPAENQVVMVNVPEDWRGDNILGALSKKVPSHFKVMNKPLKRVNGCVVLFLDSDESTRQLLELGTFVYNAGPVHHRYDCTIGICSNTPDAILKTKHHLPDLPNDVTRESVRQALIEILYNQKDWVQCTALHEYLRSRFGRQVDMKSVFMVQKVKDYLASEPAFQLKTTDKSAMLIRLSPQLREQLSKGGVARASVGTPTRLRRDTSQGHTPAMQKLSSIPEQLKHDIYYLLKGAGPTGLALQTFQQQFEARYGYPLECATYGVTNLKGLLHALPELLRVNEWQKKVTIRKDAAAPAPRSADRPRKPPIGSQAVTTRPRSMSNPVAVAPRPPQPVYSQTPIRSPPGVPKPPKRKNPMAAQHPMVQQHAGTPRPPQRPPQKRAATQPHTPPRQGQQYPGSQGSPVPLQLGRGGPRGPPSGPLVPSTNPWQDLSPARPERESSQSELFRAKTTGSPWADMENESMGWGQPPSGLGTSLFSSGRSAGSQVRQGSSGYKPFVPSQAARESSGFGVIGGGQSGVISGGPGVISGGQSYGQLGPGHPPQPGGAPHSPTKRSPGGGSPPLFGGTMQPGPFGSPFYNPAQAQPGRQEQDPQGQSYSRFQWQPPRPGIPHSESNEGIHQLIGDFSGMLGDSPSPPAPNAPPHAPAPASPVHAQLG